jgi:hypothetical protein
MSLPLTRYTVQAGRHNFRPLMPIIPMRRVRGFAVEAIFGDSCWYPPEALDDPSDWDDLSKLLGVTQAFSANSRNACMVAWRPGAIPCMIRIGAYANFPGSRIQWRELGHVEAGERFRVECRFSADTAWFKMGDMTHALDYSPPRLVRQTGMWHGGNQPAPNWMDIEAAIEFFK